MNCPEVSKEEYKDFSQRLHSPKERKPLSGEWEITLQCNHNCLHCYYSEHKAKNELEFKEVKHIIDQLYQEGCLWLCFTGGEPFARHDFLKIYTYAKKKGFIITIFTNGTLLAEKIIAYLSKYLPFRMEITLNSVTEKLYEKITGVSGSFKKVMCNILLLLKYKIPLTLKSNLMNININEFEKIKEFAANLKIDYKYDYFIDAKVNSDLAPCSLRLSPKEIIELEYGQVNIPSKESMAGESFSCSSQAKTKSTWRKKVFHCAGGTISFSISAGGKLILCPAVRHPSFDLRKGSFREGFYNFYPRLKETKFQTNSKCQDCNLGQYCSLCAGKALVETGSAEAPVDYYCQIAKLRKEIEIGNKTMELTKTT